MPSANGEDHNQLAHQFSLEAFMQLLKNLKKKEMKDLISFSKCTG